MSERGEKIDGQHLSDERLAKARAAIDASAMTDHALEAAKFAETILDHLREAWADQGFTREQAVFSVALATINLRETYPDGKDAFDAVASEAKRYYDANK